MTKVQELTEIRAQQIGAAGVIAERAQRSSRILTTISVIIGVISLLSTIAIQKHWW